MRSIEFLREEGPGNDQPMSDAEYAAQRAQGEKNLNAVKGFFGGKPAAAPAAAAAKVAPAGTSIDPIVRQRLGFPPATQKEIADYQAANPGYGKVVDSSGRPITTGSGGPVAAGGEQSVIKAAQTAAPALPTGTIDPNAGELGNQTPSTRIPSDEKYPRSAAPTAAPTAPATAQEIANLNGIANINKIRAGQILKMPNGSTYTVKPGDTLGKIAAMSGVAQGATPVPKTAPKVSPNPVPAPKPAPGATPAPVDPTKLSVAQRMATQPSPVDQFRAKVGIPAGGTSPAARPVRESKFDESVNLMRRLSNMLKG